MASAHARLKFYWIRRRWTFSAQLGFLVGVICLRGFQQVTWDMFFQCNKQHCRSLVRRALEALFIGLIDLRFTVMALRLKRDGCSVLATVCSTWVFLSRASTGRTIWNPLGFRGVKVVEEANVSCFAIVEVSSQLQCIIMGYTHANHWLICKTNLETYDMYVIYTHIHR